MHTPRTRTAAVVAILLVPLSGCASHSKSSVESSLPAISAESPPADFTLAVTVRWIDATPKSLPPRYRRSARYVMETDWILRATVGRATSEDTFPPQTRQLTAAQVQRLWDELRDSGVFSRPATATPESQTIYTLYCAAGGVRRSVRLDRDSFSDATRLVDDLAGLAWVPD